MFGSGSGGAVTVVNMQECPWKRLRHALAVVISVVKIVLWNVSSARVECECYIRLGLLVHSQVQG